LNFTEFIESRENNPFKDEMSQEQKKAEKTHLAYNVSLGKALIAAAWVDGVLNEEEMECIKSIILRLPDISFEDWRKLKIYLAYPIAPAEQIAIVDEFSEKVYLYKHRKQAWAALVEVLKADGTINLEEKQFALEMNESLKESSESFLRKLKFFLFKSQIEGEDPWPKPSKGRDKFIHEFFDNPIYFIFRKALLEEKLEIPHSKPELQKICLFAAILCWLANIDNKVTFHEIRTMRKILSEDCGLEDAIAKCILDVAFSIDVSELQLCELSSALADSTNQAERNEMFDQLCQLIISDDVVDPDEVECLRTVALYLEINEKTWVEIMKRVNVRNIMNA